MIGVYFPWTLAGTVLLVCIAVGFLLRWMIHPILSKLQHLSGIEIDERYFRIVPRFIVIWTICIGAYLLRFWLPLSQESLVSLHKFIETILIFTVGMAVAEFLVVLIRVKIGRGPMDLPTTSLSINLTRILVMAVAILMIFSILGIAIAPLLTALGVGSLAVALGLQETLSNFFAGIYILKSQIIQINDYIKLDSGQEGFVVDVGLRAIYVRTLSNTMIYVPTAKVSQSIIINYSHPTPEFSTPVEIRVDFKEDLEKVERVTLETARAVMKSLHLDVSEPRATVRYHGWGDSGAEFTVYLRTQDINSRLLLVHEFTKALGDRYRKEGISLALPQRVVH